MVHVRGHTKDADRHVLVLGALVEERLNDLE
jgi:hypothetical protein